MRTITNKAIIVTHKGAFHPDELLAVAMMRVAGFDYTVIRTRDAEIINNAPYGSFIIDVGNEFDGQNKFDHHQAKDNKHECYGKSSAGLVLDFLSQRVSEDPLAEAYGYETNWTQLLRPTDNLSKFIEFVDSRDTRVNYDPEANSFYDKVGNLLVSCNTIDIDSPEQDERFNLVVNLLVDILKAEGDFDNLISWTKIAKLSKETDESKRIEFNNRLDSLTWYITRKKKVYVGEYIPTYLLPKDWDMFVTYDKGQSAWTVMANTKAGIVLDQVQDDNCKFVHANGFVGKFISVPWGIWWDGSDGFKDGIFVNIDAVRHDIPVGSVYYR
jgi:uncharacterized UPF0160 family protein